MQAIPVNIIETLALRLNFCLGNALQEIQAYQKNNQIEHIFKAKDWLRQQLSDTLPYTRLSAEDWYQIYDWLDNNMQDVDMYIKNSIKMIFSTAVINDVTGSLDEPNEELTKLLQELKKIHRQTAKRTTYNQDLLLIQAIYQLDLVIENQVSAAQQEKPC